ncbi:MAG TPA: carboxypeptidase regulatory-like domain-containing protein [Terriglobales bacterium]|nr:carboxypeptidase regulatory-like domain-containing protein [Terriglobales bacterium]
MQGWNRRQSLLVFALVLLVCGQMFAGVTASISGTVKDPSGAAIAGATVTATNVDTAIAVTQTSNGQGFYSFQSLPLGKYTVDVEQKGFKTYRQTGLVLEVSSALTVDATLQVGQTTEKVEVAADALHVETISSQMGEVIESKRMTDVPLISRSYTDLLSLQPGVASAQSPMTGAYAGPFISAGFAPPLVSGDLNAGAYSVNGMREAANGFILNGMLTQELGYSGAGAVPNLDSIEEFRILTNNVDAEFGNYAGAQINVVTKSGTNQWHGNAFEFVRNTSLNARNYFDPVDGKGAYHQNQFGGTFGGPIVRDKIFFFADYQGNRLIQGKAQTIPNAPSSEMESGDFSLAAASDSFATLQTFSNNNKGFVPAIVDNTLPTSPNPGTAWTNYLSSTLGYPVTYGEPYYFLGTDYVPGSNGTAQYGVNCTSTAQCVFPNPGNIPLSGANSLLSPIAANLLHYIQPAAPSTVGANGTGTFSTSSGKVDLHDNKFSGRVDGNSRFGLLTAYYYFDRFDRDDPYWPSNFPLYPGFAVDSKGQTHTIQLSDVKTLSSASVNEFRLGYFRLNTRFNLPLGGTSQSLSDLGFASGANRGPGIFPGTPSVEGIPEIDFNNFVIGVPSRPNQLITNIYSVSDNFSKVIGTHTIKFGGQYHFNQLEENLSNVANGNFGFGSSFNGQASETGIDFLDFLLGAPSGYIQGQAFPSYGRSFYFGLYGQDSWRARPNLTVNFGLRYDVSRPFYEKFNEIQSIIPGEQSQVYPGAPAGWVFPGDKGVPRSLAPTRWNNFAPRLGLAYSFGDHEGVMGKMLGKAGASSIRAGYTLSYASFEGATDFNEIGDAPFGDFTGQNEPTFAAPFTNRATGNSISNFYPVAPPPKGVSPSHPASGPPYDTLAEFLNAFGTIGSSPAFYYGNRLPYAENYELSFQRQLTRADLLTLSYVGTQGHRLLSSRSANPGDPALCLATPGCGPTGESNIYINGTSVTLGTRPRLPGLELTPAQASAGLSAPIGTLLPDGNYGVIPFANDSYFITAGKSSYNSLQVDYRHTSGRLQMLLGYTYSKSLDIASGYGEQINPVNPNLSRGLSAWDQTHNFVTSYTYVLPIDRLKGPKRLTNGWSISGVTTFSTGLPVTMVETDDHSLLGTAFGGPITLAVDTPDQVAPLHKFDPRTVQTLGGVQAHFYFDPTAFAPSAIGSEGNTTRRFFHGPGINNWNMAFHKDTRLTERVNLQFRADFFNMFNHAQFATPLGILGGAVGQVTQTSLLNRTGQLSLKLSF